MTAAAAFLVVSTSLYCGFQWTVRVVVYPQFDAVDPASFRRYEQRHQRRVSVAVGPLFVLAGSAAVVAFVVRPDVASGVAGAAVAGVLVVTRVAAVPQHRRLSDGFDAPAYRRLLRADTVRLGLACVACLAGVWYAACG